MAFESASNLAGDRPDLIIAIVRSRKLLRKRALIAGFAGAVPIPGFDWAIDAALLSRLLPQISKEFGLSRHQLEQLDPVKRERVQKAVAMVGSTLIGKLITRDLVLRAAKLIGVRLTTAQAVKFVPLAGQAAGALLGYAAVRYLGEKHIKDCARVVREAAIKIPDGVIEMTVSPD